MPPDVLKVLVVDDEKDYLADFLELFSKKFNIVTANSGDEALGILDKEAIAVVVSDQRMPKMGGSELLGHVAKKCPHTVRILLTGYADLDAVVEAVNKGQIYRYVPKETPLKEIEIVIQQAVEKFQLEESNRRLLTAKKKLLKSIAIQENLSLFGTFGQQIHQKLETLVMNLFNYVFQMKKETNEKAILADFHKLQGALTRLRELSSFSRKLQVSSVGMQKGGLNLMLQEAAEKAKVAVVNNGSCEIKFDLDESIPTFSVHRYSFMRAVKEVLENALLFSPPKERRVLIRSRYVPGQVAGDVEEKPSIRVEIQDNGSGISAEEIAKTFVPFYTTFTDLTPPDETLPPSPEDFNLSLFHHYGFGLPIAQWLICLRHNGTIDLASEEGRGTTATITLPTN